MVGAWGFEPQTPTVVNAVTSDHVLMDSLGQKSEAPIIRDLIDEALAARRRRSTEIGTKASTPPNQELASKLDTVQALLLKLIAQVGATFDMGSVKLELLQEALVEARIGRMMLWELLAVPALRERGKIAFQIAEVLETYVNEGQDYSYGLAEEIKAELDADKAKSSEQESHQPQLEFEDNAALELNDTDFGQILS